MAALTTGEQASALSQAGAAMRLQARFLRRNPHDLLPVLTMPLTGMMSLLVFAAAGRADLYGHALVAALCMTIGQMTFFVGSEILASDRDSLVLEALLASPARYPLVVYARMLVLVGAGAALALCLGAAILLPVAGRLPAIHHPAGFALALALTLLAASGTGMLTVALFALGRTARTFQNSISGPLYLLGGVLVPAAYLPEALRPLSRLVFLSWSADLLRDALQPAPIRDQGLRLAALLLLGAAGMLGGSLALARMLRIARSRGALAFS
jgi:ABC-2 type transport system permease protein